MIRKMNLLLSLKLTVENKILTEKSTTTTKSFYQTKEDQSPTTMEVVPLSRNQTSEKRILTSDAKTVVKT
tara:strand:- start:1337 stop:1546 length:210 start_codon:yes stop_codon:yes gene_type:complete